LTAERNESLTEVDPWADYVAEFLNTRQETGVGPVKNPGILEALAVPRERQDNRAARRVRQIAELIGWWVAQRRHQGGTKKGLWPPTATRSVSTVNTESKKNTGGLLQSAVGLSSTRDGCPPLPQSHLDHHAPS